MWCESLINYGFCQICASKNMENSTSSIFIITGSLQHLYSDACFRRYDKTVWWGGEKEREREREEKEVGVCCWRCEHWSTSTSECDDMWVETLRVEWWYIDSQNDEVLTKKYNMELNSQNSLRSLKNQTCRIQRSLKISRKGARWVGAIRDLIFRST